MTNSKDYHHRASNSRWARAWSTKSIADVRERTRTSGFKRVLGTVQLTLTGMGFVLGSGIFVLTGAIAAKYAGPAACLTFVLAALPAGLAALCYAELVTLLPGGGGAYTYVSVGLGELPGFLVGWMLALTYIGGCATVGVGWASYMVGALHSGLGWSFPDAWSHGPLAWHAATHTLTLTGYYANLPAAVIIGLIASLMLLATRESVNVTAVLVALKLAVIALVICIGGPKVQPGLWTPFLPANTGEFGHFGWSGILQGAGVAVFAYLGVDNICTAAQEAREPERSIPRAIAVTLLVCAALYVCVSLVLTGLVPYGSLDVEDPIAVGIAATHVVWLERAVQAGSLAGLTSVLAMQMYGLPRILFAMAQDKLAPAWAGELHGSSGTPWHSTLLMGAVAGVSAAFLPLEMLGGVAASGTMLAFMAVSGSVITLRRTHPSETRAFKVPGGPYAIPLSAILACGALVAIAPLAVLFTLIGWIALGVAAYSWARRPQANAASSS